MADHLLLPIALMRITDDNDDPVPGAKIIIEDAGTSDDKNIFTDSTLVTAAANPIVADANGWVPERYIGTGDYKQTITTSADVNVVDPVDNLPGAQDTSTFAEDFASLLSEVLTKSANYTAVIADLGKTIASDASGGNVTITLPSAVTAGDGKGLTISNVGATGSTIFQTVSSQTLAGATTLTLGEQWQSLTIVSDGANWQLHANTMFAGLAAGASGNVLAYSAADTARAVWQGVPLAQDYRSKYKVKRDNSGLFDDDTDHDLHVTPIVMRDFANTFDLQVAAALVKRIDASWVTGSGNGGMASAVSLTASTWYHFHLADDGAGNTDAGFDTSLTATNLLLDTGGTVFRRMLSVFTDISSNITAFRHRGDYVYWVDPPLDINDATPGTSANTIAISVPLGVPCLAKCNAFHNANSGIYFSSPDVNDEVASRTAAPLATFDTSGTGVETGGQIEIMTDDASTVRYRALADLDVRLSVLGYQDFLTAA